MLLTNVIERANAKKENDIVVKNRRQEVQQLFINVAFKYESEFKELFRNITIGRYSNIITIQRKDSGYDFNIAVSCLPDRKIGKHTLNIGYNANSASGDKRIPFSYDNTDVQLILICENALKTLASMCL